MPRTVSWPGSWSRSFWADFPGKRQNRKAAARRPFCCPGSPCCQECPHWGICGEDFYVRYGWKVDVPITQISGDFAAYKPEGRSEVSEPQLRPERGNTFGHSIAGRGPRSR